jgi:hypothetical protein
MSVDAGIASGTSQVLVLSVWNVEMGLGIPVLLGQTKIDNIDLIAALANAHEEVVGLDVTVNERLGVNVLNARDKLIGEKKDSLQGELAVAEVEKVLQGRAEQVQDHGIVVALGTKPTYEGDTDTTSEGLVDASLVFQLRVLGLDALELDGNLLTRNDVGACTCQLW